MSFKIITKQLAKKLPIDHELNKETICDTQSYEEIHSILQIISSKELEIHSILEILIVVIFI